MDNAIVRSKIVGESDYPLNGPNKEFGSTKEDCLPQVLARRCSSIKKLQISDFCRQQIFLQQISGLKKMIPKQIMSLEEKYLRHVLELIHLRAMRGHSWPVKVNFFPDRCSSGAVGGDALFVFSSVDENIPISSCVKDPIVGSITGSTSMKNILRSPLLVRQLGPSDNDDNNINHGSPGAIQVREPLCVGSSHSQDIQKKRVVPEDQIFRCEPLHKRLVSFSSTNSTYSDPSSSASSSSSSSSSSFSSAYCHGMIHCSWNNGFPRYVFSVEDQREVYTTNLSKVGSEYVYMLYCRGGKRENEVDDEELDVVGRMRVSTSFTVCNLGTEIMETEFVLCAPSHDNEGVVQHTSDQHLKKNRGGLSKKVANMFPLSRQRRTKSKFDGSVGLQDNSLELKEQENLFPESSSFPSNLELAAIIVKQHIPHTQNKPQVGGWGLKFLEQGGNKQKVAAPQLCTNHHSTSMDMDVVIPAGLHGGPTMKNGGPYSLVERWRSGGSCDCGGWDVGCPLTLLNALSNNKHVVYPAGVFGNTNSFQLFKQGSKQSIPVIEVKNVHDGLYYIHYQSTLSALQSLSIAVAIIHSHSPTLKPKSI